MSITKKYLYNLFVLGFFFIGCSPSYSQSDTSSSSLYKTDVSIFRSFNNNRSGFLDAVIPIVDKSVFPVVIVAPIGLFTFGKINKVPYDENSGVLLGLSEGFAVGTTYLIKSIVKRKRPYEVLDKVYSKKNNSPTGDYSFPSGHTTAAFALATSLTLRYSDQPFLIGGLYLYALTVGYGRMYLGVHYPSDILAGAIIGAGTSAIIFSLRKEIIKAKNNILGTENVDSYTNDNHNGYLILGSVIGGDIINSLLSKNENKIISGSKVTIGLNGNYNVVGIHISF